VAAVLDTGVLSQFIGGWHEDFRGGPQVRAMEEEWADHCGARHAVSVNSCTSGLICAVGASGVEPGQEIIVPPYTMSATVMAPLVYNAVPVFADVEPDCFCIDPDDIERRITPRTKAIMAVDLFGLPANFERIMAIADKHGLTVIEDAAQAPDATLNGRCTGTLGHMGVHSLNFHKHIHTGEGGVVLTGDDELAQRLRLIRNHAESVVEGMGREHLVNMIGFNFRMGEMEAAIARCQLKKLPGLLAKRRANVRALEARLSEIPCLSMPASVRGRTFLLHPASLRRGRGRGTATVVQAVRPKLAPSLAGRRVRIFCGYVKPLNLLPIFQRRPLRQPRRALSALYRARPIRPRPLPVVERLYGRTCSGRGYAAVLPRPNGRRGPRVR
jgi:dTDP-4-amino-4,6-dideoxygalactose transaminase